MSVCVPRALQSVFVVLVLTTVARTASADLSSSWATQRSAELTKQALGHIERSDFATANQRLTEALVFDATYGPAYIAMGHVREQQQQYLDALKVYSAALERTGAYPDALVARATLLERLGRVGDAQKDLMAAVHMAPHELALREKLVVHHIKHKAWAAALQAARGAVILLSRTDDPKRTHAARVRAVALLHLANTTDPVVAGQSSRTWERRAIASIAKRYGAL